MCQGTGRAVNITPVVDLDSQHHRRTNSSRSYLSPLSQKSIFSLRKVHACYPTTESTDLVIKNNQTKHISAASRSRLVWQ